MLKQRLLTKEICLNKDYLQKTLFKQRLLTVNSLLSTKDYLQNKYRLIKFIYEVYLQNKQCLTSDNTLRYNAQCFTTDDTLRDKVRLHTVLPQITH